MMNKIFRNKYLITGISVIAIITLCGGGYFFGYQQGTKKPQTIIVKGATNLEGDKTDSIDFSLFWDAWQTLKNKYVDANKIDNKNLLYGAISGLLGATKDPYSVFFPPTDAQSFNQEISGEFSGIGAEIGIKDSQLVIISPLKNSPAEKADLKPMDKIVKIDKTDSASLSVEEAVKLIRGEKGTTVVLTVSRTGWDKPKEISIVRDTIQVPTVDWEMKGNIAYIRLYNFYEKSPLLFYQAISQIAFKNPQGIVLDLRGNPGGYLEAAVNLASWFLKPGQTVVTEEFGSGEKQVYASNGNGLLKDMPLVILINEGSASASEILAGALRDDRGIKLVGKKSFGKGTVQEIENLKDNSMIKITVAHWLMPKGGLIEKNGLDPDYEANLTDDDIKAAKDPQLDKALQVIKAEL